MMDRLRQAWDRLSLYLPVLLMGVLAMATYWLVRSTPIAGFPETVTAAQHVPDYFMRKFAVKTFDATGKLKSEVAGGEARHFPDTDTLEIDQAIIRSFDAAGRLTTATARMAITNGDASEVQLVGSAQVVRAPVLDSAGKEQPAMMFRGEYLHAFMDTERVTSHKPVELTRGQDRFIADTMDFDNRERVMLLNGRVKGVLVPPVGVR
jgi:lipopolysaccharide export system protein LptC